MIRTWKLLGYPAILAAALTTTPSSLSAGDDGKQNSDTKSKVTLEDVNENVKSIQKKLEENKRGADLMDNDLRTLKEKVAQLQRDVDSLMRGRTTTANYPPNTPIAPSTGRVRLVNTWPERITVLLNDKSIPVEPNQEIIVPEPVGTFIYEILGSSPDNTILRITQKQPRTLAANETFTIHVHLR